MPATGIGVGLMHHPASAGGGPPQAPSGAKPLTFIDFLNGAYWIGNVQSTIPGSVLTSNANWGIWNPVNIIPGKGLQGTPSSCNAVLTAAAASSLLTGFTVVMRLLIDAAPPGNGYNAALALTNVSGQTSRYRASLGANQGTSGWQGSMQLHNQTDNLTAPGSSVSANAKHALAATLTFPRCDWATDGVAGGTSLIATQQSPSPLPDTVGLTSSSAGASQPCGWIQSLAFYAPQPLTDLPALSTP